MFVDPTRGRSQGFALVAAASVLALGACNDPDQNTNLRPDGDPEVLAVLVMNDAAAHLFEQATYCALNDEKRPAIVGLPDFTAPEVCPEDLSKGADEVTNAYPDGWYIRIMFDELLDPEIEELTEVKDPDTMEGTDTFVGSIAKTHPVKLECESVGGGFVEVEYDGYYSPSGNAVTWPLGPSLVIKPNEPKSVATGKSCRVTINDNVVDKSGNKVPSTQRGAYNFKIAPIEIVLIDPPDDPDGEAPIDALQIFSDNFYVQFNTAVDEASLCDEGVGMDECEFTITPEDTGFCSTDGAACVVSKAGADCPTAGDTCDLGPDRYYAGSLVPFGFTDTEFYFGPAMPIQSDHMYKFAFKAGTKIKDRCGVETTFGPPSVDDQTEVNFKTTKFALKATLPGTGDLVTALRRPEMQFTNVLNLDTLTAADYTISPAPQVTGAAFTTTTGGNAQLRGFFKMNTEYTFTILAGAKISDALGVEYTQAEAKTIVFKTQPAITVGTTADKSTFTKSTPASNVGITLTFNQAMLPATLTEGTDYTITPAPAAGVLSTVILSGCTMSSTACQLKVQGALAPGEYTFTLKAGAMIDDALTPVSTYTQAADKVVHFTVKNAEPSTPIVCL
jgi:hypothetical protein